MKLRSGPRITFSVLAFVVAAAVGGIVSLIVFTRPGTLSVGETIQASVVIGLVVVTALNLVFTARMSAATEGQAKATSEQVEATRRLLGRSYNAELIALVVDPVIENVRNRLEQVQSRLGWMTSDSRPAEIPDERLDLFVIRTSDSEDFFHKGSIVPPTRYFAPYPLLQPLPGTLSEIGQRRVDELGPEITAGVQQFNKRVELWRVAATGLSIELADFLRTFFQDPVISRLSATDNAQELIPFITYIVFRSSVGYKAVDVWNKAFGTVHFDDFERSARIYETHQQSISNGIDRRFRNPVETVETLTKELIRTIWGIESDLRALRDQTTSEYRLEESIVEEIRSRYGLKPQSTRQGL